MRNSIFLISLCFFLYTIPLSLEYSSGQEEQVKQQIPMLRDKNFLIEEYVKDLQYPTTIDFIGNDLLVLEKNGDVRLVKEGILQQESILKLDVSKTIEEGLIGILVKENFVYLHYTTEDEIDKSTSNFIYKFRWDGTQLVEPKIIKEIHGGNNIHNAGVMAMDSSGTVFMMMGDLGNRKGILQNYDSGTPDDTSVIMPIDPPSEYFAIGIRNGYGLSFDPITQLLWDTENGPDSFDEINLVRKNFNSGWDKIQGPASVDQKKLLINEEFNYSDPEFSWEKTVGVTAIHFIQSPFLKEYHNSVFVGDFNNGILYKFDLNENRDAFLFQDESLKDLVLNIEDEVTEIIFGTGFSGITDIKQGPDGLIYIISIGDGKIYRIIPNSSDNNTEIKCDEEITHNANFSGCELKNLDLSNKDLSGVNFSFTKLKNIDMSNVNFQNANFAGAIISDTKINNTNFAGANLNSIIITKTLIINSKFNDAEIKSANFEKNIFDNVSFNGANLEQSNFKESTLLNSNLENVNLIGSNFEYAKAPSINFKNSILNFGNFNFSDLSNANLENTIIHKTVFDNANLENVNLKKSDNFQVSYKNTNLQNADFSFSRLAKTDFNKSDLSGIDLMNVYPINSNFENVVFSENSQINTCLEHDYVSRVINKIFRIFNINNDKVFEGIKEILLNVCN